MEGVESALFLRIQCPRFTSVEQRAEHAGLVHLRLGADGQHRDIPYPPCQASHCSCCFADSCVQFGAWEKLLKMLEPR